MAGPKFQPKGKYSFTKLGLPLVVVCVGGAYMLSHFLGARNEIRNRREVFGSMSMREFSLQEEHDKMVKNLDIDNYKLSKIPNRENLKDLPELKDQYDDEQ